MQELKQEINLNTEILKINYIIENNKSDSIIIFVPGHMDSSVSYKKIIDIANNKSNNFNYLSFDIAWGKSDISKYPYKKNLQLNIINSFLEQIVLKRYAKKIHLIGHSMGGELILIKGLQESKKIKDLNTYKTYIKTLTAMAPASYPRTLKQLDNLDFIARLPKFFIQFIGNKRATPEKIYNRINDGLYGNKKIGKELAHEIYKSFTSNNGILRAMEVQKFMHPIKGSEYIKEYPKIKIPLQFIFGENDKKIVKNAFKFFQRDFPKNKILIYKNCPHYIQYQYPEKLINDILTFISENE